MSDSLPGAAVTDSNDFYCLHSDVCKTLANEKRQRILDALRHGELGVSELQARTGIPQATLSQHLAILRTKGVVLARREGSRVHYSISNPKIIQAFDLISEVMAEQLAARKDSVDGALGD
jgi:DNA-binding transcriptional ArsR family regulator